MFYYEIQNEQFLTSLSLSYLVLSIHARQYRTKTASTTGMFPSKSFISFLYMSPVQFR